MRNSLEHPMRSCPALPDVQCGSATSVAHDLLWSFQNTIKFDNLELRCFSVFFSAALSLSLYQSHYLDQPIFNTSRALEPTSQGQSGLSTCQKLYPCCYGTPQHTRLFTISLPTMVPAFLAARLKTYSHPLMWSFSSYPWLRRRTRTACMHLFSLGLSIPCTACICLIIVSLLFVRKYGLFEKPLIVRNI